MKKINFATWILYLSLFLLSFIFTYPFLWMVSASFKTQNEFFAGGLNLIPRQFSFENFIRAWNSANFSLYFKNSFIVTISVVFIVLFTTSFAGYAIGRYEFVGKKFIMAIFIASTTIPLVFTVIPTYELLKALGLSQSLFGLILAESGGGFVIFLMLFASYYRALPKELEEAAIIDGCNFIQVYHRIMFPLAKPVMVTVVIMRFIWTWNSFLLPLVITLNNPKIRTLAVGLYALRGENVVDWTGIASGATIAIIPVLLIFILLQRYFVEGISGAVKS